MDCEIPRGRDKSRGVVEEELQVQLARVHHSHRVESLRVAYTESGSH